MSLHATILIRLVLLGKCNQEDEGIVKGSLAKEILVGLQRR